MPELIFMRVVQVFFDSTVGNFFVILSARWLIFVLPLLAFIAYRFDKLSRRALVNMGWSTLLAGTLALSAEALIGRARPFVTDPTLAVLIPPPHTFSFPSAHASIVYAFALTLFAWHRGLGIVALLCADLVAIGRVAAGVHYPTDVLGGLFVGVVSFTMIHLATCKTQTA